MMERRTRKGGEGKREGRGERRGRKGMIMTYGAIRVLRRDRPMQISFHIKETFKRKFVNIYNMVKR